MHLGKLELGLGANTLGKSLVADNVAQSLAVVLLVQFSDRQKARYNSERPQGTEIPDIPFGFMLRNDLALGVIADHQGSKVAHNVQLLGSESCCHCD